MRQKIMSNSGKVQLPSIPMASEASVHMLTGIGFPPPALFFADPGKKWTMDDFEKSNKPSLNYSVTDEENVTNMENMEQPQDRMTSVAVEPELETTTMEKPVDGMKNDREQDVLSTTEKLIVETQQGQETTTKIVDGTRDRENETIAMETSVDGTADLGQETIVKEKPINETGTDREKETIVVEKPVNETGIDRAKEPIIMEKPTSGGKPERGQGGVATNNPSINTRFEKLTVTFDRRKYPTNIWQPFRTIILTSRLIPKPMSNIRFSQVGYMGVRHQRETPTTN